MSENKDNVKVVVRIRPLNDREQSSGQTRRCITSQNNQITIDIRPEPKSFYYDFVADENVTQEQMFDQVGKPITNYCISGYNATIFAYGQTGAGKTFTIQGSGYDDLQQLGDINDSRGLLPRCFEFIFDQISILKSSDESYEFLVKCSYLEIYQEQVIDLLYPGQSNLQIREDMKNGVYVDGIIEETVQNIEETYQYIQLGARNRHVGSTSMNKESSRSHSVFTLSIESRSAENGMFNIKSSKFHLIDLAGSERQRATDAAGERLKEAGMINKSLSALGNVINSLVDLTEGKSRHIHYRDSKLTFLLKDSLGGNSKTCIIANISPSFQAQSETMSTLKFAQRAKLITNKAVINEDTTGAMSVLHEEIRRLKAELAKQQALIEIGGNGQIPEDRQGIRDRQLQKLLEHNIKLLSQQEMAYGYKQEQSDKYVQSLRSAIETLESTISRDRMIIKFRDATIQSMQKGDADGQEKILKEEIALLQEQINVNPQQAKLFAENQKLIAELNELKAEKSEEEYSMGQRLKEALDFSESMANLIQDLVAEKDNFVQKHQQQQQNPDYSCNEADIKLRYIDQIEELTQELANEKKINVELQENYSKQVQILELKIEEQISEVKISQQKQQNNFQGQYLEEQKRASDIASQLEQAQNELYAKESELEDLQYQQSKWQIVLKEKEGDMNDLIKFGVQMTYVVDELQNQLRKVLVKKDQDSSNYKVAQSDLYQIKNQLQNLKEDSILKENINCKLNEQIKQLQNEIEDEKLKKEAESNNERSQLLKTIQQLENNIAQNKLFTQQREKELTDSIQELKMQIEQQNNEISESQAYYTNEINNLMNTISQLEQTNDETMELQESIKAVQQDNSLYVQEINLLKENICKLKESRQRITEQLKIARKELETVKKEYKNLQNQEYENQNNNKQLWEENRQLEEQRLQCEYTIQNLQDNIKNHQNSIEDLQFQYESQIQTASLTYLDGIQNLQDEIKELSDAVATKHSELLQSKSQVKHLQEKIEQLSQEKARLLEEFSKVQQDNSLKSELDQAKQTIRQLKEENCSKMEILKNTNKNILKTRNEISMWKKCIDEKNQAIQELRKEIRRKDEEINNLNNIQMYHDSYQDNSESETKYLRYMLNSREKELQAFKEKSNTTNDYDKLKQKLKAFKDKNAILKQREQEVSQKQQEIQNLLVQLKEEKNKLQRDKDQINKENHYRFAPASNAMQQISNANKRSKNYQIDNLTDGLERITEYVFSLPSINFYPQEDNIVDSTIQAIELIYQNFSDKTREIREKEMEIQNKNAKISILENEQQILKQKIDLQRVPQATNIQSKRAGRSPVTHYNELLSASNIRQGEFSCNNRRKK